MIWHGVINMRFFYLVHKFFSEWNHCKCYKYVTWTYALHEFV